MVTFFCPIYRVRGQGVESEESISDWGHYKLLMPAWLVGSDGSAPLARRASMLNWAFFLYLEARSAPNLISSFAWTIS